MTRNLWIAVQKPFPRTAHEAILFVDALESVWAESTATAPFTGVVDLGFEWHRESHEGIGPATRAAMWLRLADALCARTRMLAPGATLSPSRISVLWLNPGESEWVSVNFKKGD